MALLVAAMRKVSWGPGLWSSELGIRLCSRLSTAKVMAGFSVRITLAL